jgi:hypothetical protein
MLYKRRDKSNEKDSFSVNELRFKKKVAVVYAIVLYKIIFFPGEKYKSAKFRCFV